jgi:ADP-ribose pyrophosphatase YjhB (NUDIX family)
MTSVARIQLAVSAIVIRGNTVLLVRRGHPPDRDKWAFPGGRFIAGETTRNAVLRELAEETGLAGDVDRVFDVYDFVSEAAAAPGTTPLPFHFTLIVFRVDVDNAADAIAGDDAAEVRWVRPRDGLALPMPASMHDALKRLDDEMGRSSR